MTAPIHGIFEKNYELVPKNIHTGSLIEWRKI